MRSLFQSKPKKSPKIQQFESTTTATSRKPARKETVDSDESFQSHYARPSAIPLTGSLSGSTLVELSDAEQSSIRSSTPSKSPSTRSQKSPKSPKIPDKASWKHMLKAQRKNVQPTIKQGLKITKEVSAVFPPLKAVSGALLELMNMYEQYTQNNDSIRNVARRVNEILESLDDQDVEMIGPEELQRISRKFQDNGDRLEALMTKGKYSKTVQAEDIEYAINEISNNLDHTVTMYQISMNKGIFKRLEKLGFSSQNRDLRDLLEPRNMEPMDMGISPCLPNTRMEVLEQIYRWASNPDHFQRVFWLKGHAGSGKSAIAMSFCLGGSDYRVGASFFCCRDNAERCNVHNIFPSIALQLASRFPRYRNVLLSMLESREGHSISSLNDQFKLLIVEPLQKSGLRAIIIIDALDECLDKNEVAAVVTLLASQIKGIPQVKFFITARPEDHIRVAFREFQQEMDNTSYILELHHQNPELINRDIRTFLRKRLLDISRSSSEIDLSEEWPSEEHLKVLVQKSSQLFIFAATMITFIEDRNFGAREQLEKLVGSNLQTTNHYLGASGTLDKLYKHILLQLGYDYNRTDLHDRFKLVVGCIVVAFQALSENMLDVLCQGKGKDAVHSVIRRLHSVMDVPTDRSKPIYLYHQSFRDYITDSNRCQDPRFYISVHTHHRSMAIFCLKLMKASLTRRNIYDSETNPRYRYAFNSEIKIEDREKAIGKHLEYACRFWTRHLLESFVTVDGFMQTPEPCPELSELGFLVTDFILFRQIFWLEILSVINDLDNASEYLQQLCGCLDKIFEVERNDLVELILDAQRMISTFFPCIKESAGHIYHSALPLSPRSCSLRSAYRESYHATEAKIMQGIDDHWKAKPRILDHHTWKPSCLKYSSDGSMIIIVGEKKAELLSAKSGKTLGTFKIPKANPIVFAFSANTKYPLLVSSWTDGSIILWDTNTCGIVSKCYELTACARHVSFSPDGKQFTAVDDNGNICVWDTISGQLHYKFHSTSDRPYAVSSWLLEGNTFVSYDGSIIESWDTLRGYKLNVSKLDIFEGGMGEWDVELHPNRAHLIIRRGSIVKMYELESRKLLASIDHPDFASSEHLTVSSDIQYVALSENSHVKVYSISSGNATLLASLPPCESIASLAFSQDSSQLAFASQKDVRIWEVQHLPQLSITCDRSIHGSVIALSGDGMYFATGFTDGTINVVDLNSGDTDSFVVMDNFDRVTSPKALSFSPKSKYLSIVLEEQNRSINVDGFSVDIWALDKKKLRHMSKPGESVIKDTSFIDERVVLGFAEDRVEVWDAHTGTHLQTVLCEMRLKLDSHTWIEPKLHDFAIHRRSESGEKRRARVQIANHSAGQNPSVILHEVDRNDVRAAVLDQVQRQKRVAPYPVIGGDWIVNQREQRILWVPHEWRITEKQIRHHDVNCERHYWKHEERVGAQWSSGKLALLGPRGQVLAVDFADANVELPTSDQVVEALQYKRTTELSGLKRSLFLPVEKKK
ncbi:hypothetical protein BDQ17DRAFT_1432354 [Cyathus striatus]|nr:hypothetical protein BDQ17DRAFT_1432354 [Cyathus striatus]